MSNKPGKGHKRCRNKDCGGVIKGARTMICPHCGTDQNTLMPNGMPIVEGDIRPNTRNIVRFPDGYSMPEGRVNLIHIPAGACPVTLHGDDGGLPDDDQIVDWACNLRQRFLTERSEYIRNDGLAYWAANILNPKLEHPPGGEVMTYIRSLIMALPDITVRTIEAEA